MNNNDLVDYWIRHHNEKYFEYLLKEDEPRYGLKTFFLNSFYLFKTFGSAWEPYLEKYQDIFKRDPSNDYYKYRNPLVTIVEEKRKNALEWTTLFEIISQVGYPYNVSAKDNLLKYSKEFLSKGQHSPNSEWIDFMLSSAVANLPDDFRFLKDWLPSKISEYITLTDRTPHQYIAYLNALKVYEKENELKTTIIKKLIKWIESPSGNPNGQILVWARLITRLNWLSEIKGSKIQNIIKSNFLETLNKVHSVEWSNSPMILEAFYYCSSVEEKKEILYRIGYEITPSSFFKFHELFPFINPFDEALDVNDEVLSIKEKCESNPPLEKCLDCIKNKKGDCWTRIIAKVTETAPRLHSGYEVADVVIYKLSHGIYIVIKANPIMKQRGEGDILFRQCVSLFSTDHALVIYFNSHETAPIVIESIRKAAASMSKTNPRFEVIEPKYIRQIYNRYISDEEE